MQLLGDNYIRPAGVINKKANVTWGEHDPFLIPDTDPVRVLVRHKGIVHVAVSFTFHRKQRGAPCNAYLRKQALALDRRVFYLEVRTKIRTPNQGILR